MNIALMIKDLKAERARIDRAIESLEAINGGAASGNAKLASLSVYEAGISILTDAGKPMQMRDIVDAILASGKEFKSDNPRSIISTTLYKALKEKRDCQLVTMKDKKIGLKGWK